MTTPPAARPTRVRYAIVLVGMMVTILLYLERVCLNMADGYVREDVGLSKERMDDIFMAFFLAYALGQVPGGWLAQRFGPRRMLTLYLFGLAVFGAFIAGAHDFWTLFLARFLLGLSQAGSYPTLALVVKRWFPPKSRGTASSVVAFGGRFGGATANLLTGFLIVWFVPPDQPATVAAGDILDAELFATQTKPTPNDPLAPVRDKVCANWDGAATAASAAAAVNAAVARPDLADGIDTARVALDRGSAATLKIPAADRPRPDAERLNRLLVEKTFPGSVRQIYGAGWRPTLMAYALAGLVVGVLFWVVARDTPDGHPWANPAEIELIADGEPAHAEGGTTAVPWRALVVSRNQWIFCVNQVFNNLGWVFLITYTARFLTERFAVPIDELSFMTTAPLLAGAFGMIAGGWYTDRLARRAGRRLGRAVPMGWFRFPCVPVMVACAFLPTAWGVVVALCVTAWFTDFGIPATWAFAQETGGKQAGTVLGWANMWGNLGAGLGAKLIGVVSAAHGWDAAMYLCAAAFAVTGVAGAMLNADEPLIPADGVVKPD